MKKITTYKRDSKRNPIHVNPIDLIWLSRKLNNTLITPKPDGVYSRIKIDKYECAAEYLEDQDIYLVFDIIHKKGSKSNILSNLNILKKLHPIIDNEIPTISSMEELDKFNRIEEDYLSKTISKEIKWFVKSGFINNMSPDDFLNALEMKVNHGYNTDGYIIYYIPTSFAYKYKPKEHLTIDLKKDNKWNWTTIDKKKIYIRKKSNVHKAGIWRCYWDVDTKHWIPMEYREDKCTANPLKIVKQLESYHKKYWKATDLIPFAETVYYDHIKKDIPKNMIDYIISCKERFGNHMKYIVDTYDISAILDLGCGKGKIADYIKDSIITGIDIDPCNISICSKRYRFNNSRWFVGNFLRPLSQIFPFSLLPRYDLVVMNNTINYVDNLLSFFEDLNEYTGKDTLLYIHTLDWDKVSIKEQDGLIKTKIINTNNHLVEFDYPWNNNIITERLISMSYLDDVAENYGWKILKEFNNVGLNEFDRNHTSKIYKHE